MTTFNTGYSSIGVADVEAELDHGSDVGADFVELTMNTYPPAELADNAERIRSLASEHDLELLVHLPHGGSDAMIGSSDDAVRRSSRRAFETALEAAGDIGARKAVLHVDAKDELLLSEAGDFDGLCDTVSELTSVARTENVELCVENMLGRKRRRLSPRQTAEIASQTGCSLTFDTGHARTMGYDEADMASFLEAHAGSVSHLHLNDTRDATDEHLPFGAGTIDFETVLSAFPDSWEGTLTLEITTTNYEYITFSHQKLSELISSIA